MGMTPGTSNHRSIIFDERRDPWIGSIPLLLLAAIALIPVWTFKYFPTTDGGAHVANADVLHQYFRPAGAAYRQYYELNPLPLPNSLGHFVLALLMFVLPPLVAEKLFISAYVLLLPLSIRYAAIAIRRSAGWLAFLAVPLSLNWIFHQGFYNFLISVAVFFFLLGYWLRRRETMNARRAVVLGLLGLLLYAGHLLSITLACAAIFILTSWFTAAQAYRLRRQGKLSWPAMMPGIASRGLLTFAGLLPAIALVAWFQLRGYAGKPDKLQIAIFKTTFWKDLFSLPIMISYRARYEQPLALALVALLLLLIVGAILHKIRRQNWTRRDGLLFIPLAFSALYFTRGDQASGQLFIPQRLIFFIDLTLILFLAAQTFPMWVRRGVVGVSAILAIALTTAHWPAYRGYNEQMDEFLEAAERIEAQSTFLPLVMSPRGLPLVVDPGGLRSQPFFSAAGYAAVNRQAIDLRNYEAGLNYFPIRYRDDVNPYKKLAILRGKEVGLDLVPQRIDLARYMASTRGRVDYVVLWGVTETFDGETPAARVQKLREKQDIIDQLARDYTLIYTSPAHRARLWRLKTAK